MGFLRRLFIKLALIAVVGGGIVAYGSWDRATNFVETTAEVTGIDEVCYMKKTERGVGSKTTRTTREGPCGIVSELNRSHPEFQDFDLIKVTTIEFRYRSPADGQFHRGSQREENRRESGLPLRKGDSLKILAHKTDPGVTQRF